MKRLILLLILLFGVLQDDTPSQTVLSIVHQNADSVANASVPSPIIIDSLASDRWGGVKDYRASYAPQPAAEQEVAERLFELDEDQAAEPVEVAQAEQEVEEKESVSFKANPDEAPKVQVDAEVPADDQKSADALSSVKEPFSRKLSLKTNIVGLSMSIANVAIEFDLARHLSFSLPVYYSAWDYFTPKVKFRTFAVQPELRYWPSADNEGLFAGAHFGLAYYNLAFGEDYRYQDHGGNTPAIGGGLSVGYRMPLGQSSRWKMEFSIGVGGYSLQYDKFHNTNDVKDGLLVGQVKKSYWDIDQATVSLSYTFGLKRKEGRR